MANFRGQTGAADAPQRDHRPTVVAGPDGKTREDHGKRCRGFHTWGYPKIYHLQWYKSPSNMDENWGPPIYGQPHVEKMWTSSFSIEVYSEDVGNLTQAGLKAHWFVGNCQVPLTYGIIGYKQISGTRSQPGV